MSIVIRRGSITLLISLYGLAVLNGCADKMAKASYQLPRKTDAVVRDSKIPTRLVVDSVNVRIVAANLTSGNEQSYSLDNENHTNDEGAGARILKGLEPDVVLIQEFNTGTSTQQWVTQTFGPDYEFAKESGAGIPNGIVSRYPIVAEGEWDDPTQSNRDFAWAKIRAAQRRKPLGGERAFESGWRARHPSETGGGTRPTHPCQHSRAGLRGAWWGFQHLEPHRAVHRHAG